MKKEILKGVVKVKILEKVDNCKYIVKVDKYIGNEAELKRCDNISNYDCLHLYKDYLITDDFIYYARLVNGTISSDVLWYVQDVSHTKDTMREFKNEIPNTNIQLSLIDVARDRERDFRVPLQEIYNRIEELKELVGKTVFKGKDGKSILKLDKTVVQSDFLKNLYDVENPIEFTTDMFNNIEKLYVEQLYEDKLNELLYGSYDRYDREIVGTLKKILSREETNIKNYNQRNTF